MVDLGCFYFSQASFNILTLNKKQALLTYPLPSSQCLQVFAAWSLFCLAWSNAPQRHTESGDGVPWQMGEL